MNEIKLTALDPITIQLRSEGIETWRQLMEFVKQLPYGRNTMRDDFDLVLRERKGSCSSKHAFLKKQGDLNGIKELELIMAIYKMNAENTVGIGTVLEEHKIKYIPEAHCYLTYAGQRLDLTNSESDISKIITDIIEEQVIQPEQVISYKVAYHKKFIDRWLTKEGLPYSIEELWRIREACKEKLSN